MANQRPYFCKYYSTWFTPNIYNGYVDNADLCKNHNNPHNVCLQCAQYLNQQEKAR